MVDQVFQLTGRSRHVGGHDNGVDLGRGEPQQQELQTVSEMQVDFVTAANSERLQHVCRSIDASVEISVGMAGRPAIDVVEEDEHLLRIRVSTVFQNLPQGAISHGVHDIQTPAEIPPGKHGIMPKSPDPSGDAVRLLDNTDAPQATPRHSGLNLAPCRLV